MLMEDAVVVPEELQHCSTDRQATGHLSFANSFRSQLSCPAILDL